MLTRLKLSNFKAWRESGDIQLKPVTLLLGENSTGKSSLLQSLLLMKQTATSPDHTIHLNLGDEVNDYVDMGSFEDLLTRNPEKRKVGIELDAVHNKDHCFFSVEYAQDSKKSPVIDSMKLSPDSEQWFRVARTERSAFGIYLPGETRTTLKSRSFAPERGIAFSADAIAALGESGKTVQNLSLQLRRELEGISYLGPLRNKPKRTYLWNRTRPGIIGDDGSNAIPALLASAQAGKRNDDDLVASVSRWLKKMKIADRLEVKQLSAGHYSVLIHRDGIVANLRDVGIGISQVLPVLVLAYFAPSYSTVLLEEPEIHLHPQAQSLLAELFLEVSKKRHVQFIVETHSEHLFRRMQTLVAKKKAKPEECALYFVERHKSDAVLKTLEMDAFGRLSDWPKNFFGDATGEVREQAKQTMLRMKKERSAS
ncbi:DUF3696 domain-containing protein [uncultured Endozoicomonas sp.]|uniref:AAA family ATPase n=1 Tax=uncultured Endozoicomonas sp. TaxID=432652 RepID=UPI0026044F59|nr:DUF3696 domain-containing protein [uncultured Endozoicomonas sp.]